MYLATGPDPVEQRRPVTLTLEAASSQAPVARSVAEMLAIMYGFDLDDVADIKLAVDEACGQLERVSGGDPALTMTIRARHRELALEITSPVAGEGVIEQTGFGWHVLTTLADTVSTHVSEDPSGSSLPGARLLTITFTKSPSPVR